VHGSMGRAVARVAGSRGEGDARGRSPGEGTGLEESARPVEALLCC